MTITYENRSTVQTEHVHVSKKDKKHRRLDSESNSVMKIEEFESSKMDEDGPKAKKAKKRKSENSNDDQTVVAKIKKKTSNNNFPRKKNSTEATPKEDGLMEPNIQNDDAKENAQSDCEDGDIAPKMTEKEVRRITGKSLRTSFNSADGMAMLKKFVTICNDDKKYDLAVQYLNAGGSPLEVLRLLDKTDKKNSGNAITVFSAMEIVIMKILEKYPQYHSSAVESCRHLVNSYLSSIHSMLSSGSNAKQRRVVLRLLTAVVSLGGTLPRELLGHLSLHSQVLDTLSSHTLPTDPRSVRTSFVHFVLAFLVEGNVSVVRALLDKRGVVSCIFPDLMYDTHHLVNLVLTTVKTYILENPGISKTIKLHTFSTPVVQNLVSLYNWKGPKNWPGKHQKKHNDESSGYTDPEEKKIVVEVVHEFLLTLLTSNKYGIIFHDRSLGTSGRKNNQLANTILQSLDRPWEHAKPADLVVKILVACPDLVRSQITYTESYLEPAVSQKWILLMEFIEQIIKSLDPEVCMKPCLSELTTPQLFSALSILTVPPIILKNAILPAINHDSAIVRHASVRLLTVMLLQLKNFMNTVRSNSFDQSEIAKLVNIVTDYVLKNVPGLDSVLIAWNKALQADKEIEDNSTAEMARIFSIPNHKDILNAILDLLLMYRDVCPQLLESGSALNSSIDSTTLLTGLNTLDNTDEKELGSMKVKALQFLLALDSSAFAPEKQLFQEAVPFLISLLDARLESTQVSSHARSAIKTLLYTCGLFEGCSYQADIWISSCLSLDSIEDRIKLAGWLVEILRETAKDVNKYVELVTKAEEAAGEQLYSKTAIEDIFTELMERDISNGRNRSARILPSVSISPLLPAALEKVQDNESKLLLHYLSHVAVHTLHCQAAPNALVHLVNNLEELPSRLYINTWRSDGEHMHIKKPFTSKSEISRLSKALIADNKIDVNKIFRGNRKVSFKIEEEEYNLEHSMNSDDVLALLRLSLFYFTQLIQQDKLTELMNSNVKIALTSLLHIVKDVQSTDENLSIREECCRWILAHPLMLQYFSPLHKRNNLVEKYSTEMIAYICPIIIDLFAEEKIYELLIPFKDKFMTKLLSALKKCLSGGVVKDSSAVVRFVKILRLSSEDIIEILTIATELSLEKLSTDKIHLSMWGLLIPELLSASVVERQNDQNVTYTFDKSLIEKICLHMVQLSTCKNVGLDLWINSLLLHLKRFPHNIAAIDKNFFLSLIKGKMSPSALELSSFLTSRNTKFIHTYVKYALHNSSVFKDRNAVFTILSSMQDCEIQPQFFLKLYEFYKDDISAWFSDPDTIAPYVKQNIAAAVRLIDTVLDPKTCNDTCDMILSNGDKLLAVDVNYIDLLKCVFTKAVKLENVGNSRLVDFVQILIHITVSALKKDSKNVEKHNSLCQKFLNILSLIDSNENDCHFHEIRKNHSWPQFTRFSLKLGLKASKENDQQVQLLKTLVRLCGVVYEDDGDDEYVKTLFEMTTSHSEFINVMLGASSTKRDLVELLLVLVKKNNTLMASIHVPIYLGAYNATLSETDQLILQLLQYYESCNVKLTDYRPYLWGSAAASHYSVKSGADTALWRQPSTSQVLDLFVQDIVNNTIQNYPIDRKLKNSELHTSHAVYDPAFYLPLLCYLLSDNSVVACHKITQSGALALAFVACGSMDSQTRLAAYTVISRYYYHLEATNSKEKSLWMHFVDVFRNGVCSSKAELNDARISCLVTTFMARASLVTTQPLHPLYAPLQNFLMAKPALDLTTVPEFLHLFHSSEIDHKIHRLWILEVVRDGLKSVADAEIVFRCVLFKMLFDFYSSVLADRKTKNLILQVVNSAVKIPHTARLLVTGYGLLPWLHEIIYLSDAQDLDFVAVFIDVMRNLFNSLAQVNEKKGEVYFMLLRTMVNLKQHLSRSTDIDSYKNYIITLERIVSIRAGDFCKVLSMKDIRELVQLSKTISEEVSECEDILLFGSKFTAKPCDSLSQSSATLAKSVLKKLLIMWCSNNGVK